MQKGNEKYLFNPSSCNAGVYNTKSWIILIEFVLIEEI